MKTLDAVMLHMNAILDIIRDNIIDNTNFIGSGDGVGVSPTWDYADLPEDDFDLFLSDELGIDA